MSIISTDIVSCDKQSDMAGFLACVFNSKKVGLHQKWVVKEMNFVATCSHSEPTVTNILIVSTQTYFGPHMKDYLLTSQISEDPRYQYANSI